MLTKGFFSNDQKLQFDGRHENRTLFLPWHDRENRIAFNAVDKNETAAARSGWIVFLILHDSALSVTLAL